MNNALGVIADIEGLSLTEDDKQFLVQKEITGLILFSRNYESPAQLKILTQSIKTLRPDLLISVDQEGGRVQRFREGFTRFASMISYEAIYKEKPEAAIELAELAAWLLAVELIEHGVDLTFAPVLDIERGCSRVIGDRAFGHSSEVVIALASAWTKGLNRAGMKSVGKHFPGHGAVTADSHHELPIDPRPLSELEYDIEPFSALIKQQYLAGIMPAHVIYPTVDSEHTAGFSPLWLQGVLRNDLGFDGVIFSDDLSMEGAASGGDSYQRAIKAATAGANALVVCNNRSAAVETVRAVRHMQTEGKEQLSLADWVCSAEDSSKDEKAYARQVLQQVGLIL